MSEIQGPTLPSELAPIPSQHRRDIHPTNFRIDHNGLTELINLLEKKNEDAQKLQNKSENRENYSSDEILEDEIKKAMRISFEIIDSHKNSTSGGDRPDLYSGNLPDDIMSIYLSNTEVFKLAASGRKPRNCVDLFLDFERPSMKLEGNNSPSNATENRSVINVYGYDEDWVISTQQKLVEFFERRRTNRAALHKSNAYDLYLYVAALPIILWTAYKIEINFPGLSENNSTVFVVALYIYGIVIAILVTRSLFHYVRWLYPPVELFPRNRKGAIIQKGVLVTVVSSLLISFLYDVIQLYFLKTGG